MNDKEVYEVENYKSSNLKVFKGFLTYVLVFIIIIPYLLSINGLYNILKYYIPNVDLIAAVVSFDGGILKKKLFSNIYDSLPTTNASYLSKIFINYFALIGLTYIISKETYLNNSISSGWSLGFIMLLVTYLLPTKFIETYMNNAYNYFYEKTENRNKSYNISFMVGALLVISIIYFEKTVITLFRDNLINIANYIKSF
jgi:hypothetical protein